MIKRLIKVALVAVFGTLFLSGCAHKGPILIDFMYQSPQVAAPTAPKATVGVSPFKDDRGKSDSVVGKRYLELSDQGNELVVQGTAVDRVSGAMKSALRARSVTVQDAPAWDLTDAGVPAGTDLVISGEIKTLWVEATSKLANTDVKAEAQIRVVIADAAQKKIIRVLNVSSKLSRQVAIASPAFMGKTLTEALTTAIDQVFTDDEVKKRLQ